VGILDGFERGLEKAVNGAFAKTFRSGLQPIDVASALKSDMDAHAQVISRDRILVPNAYTVSLNPGDYDRLDLAHGAITHELLRLVEEHATRQHYSYAGPLTLSFREDPDIAIGLTAVASNVVDTSSVRWTPALDIAGRLYPITGARTVLGRGADCTITINDPGVSKQHAAVLWNTHKAVLRDLGSTNGTSIHGEKIVEAELLPDMTFRIGRTAVTFRIVPQEQLEGQR